MAHLQILSKNAEIAQLKAEIKLLSSSPDEVVATLRQEIAHLQAENQQLRSVHSPTHLQPPSFAIDASPVQAQLSSARFDVSPVASPAQSQASASVAAAAVAAVQRSSTAQIPTLPVIKQRSPTEHPAQQHINVIVRTLAGELGALPSRTVTRTSDPLLIDFALIYQNQTNIVRTDSAFHDTELLMLLVYKLAHTNDESSAIAVMRMLWLLGSNGTFSYDIIELFTSDH